MAFLKNAIIVGVLLSCMATFAAEYHKLDLFPIGFTGFTFTGLTDHDERNPYGSGQYNTWFEELELLESTHCNFIGCADGAKKYYIDLNPNSSKKDFYNEVCLEADSAIYLVPHAAYLPIYIDWNKDGDTSDTFVAGDTIRNSHGELEWVLSEDSKPRSLPLYETYSTEQDRWSNIWRAYWPEGRYGTGYANSFWYAMADSGGICYDVYFDETNVEDSLFWGYNPFVEDPACYSQRLNNTGLWEADDSLTRTIRSRETTGSGGLYGHHRMIIAKCQPREWMLQQGGEFNIFSEVPNIDAVVKYCALTPGYMSYGNQGVFDTLLYSEGACHDVAIYMQKYGNTTGGPTGQKRRWIACHQIHWEFYYDESAGEEKVKARRPCPPEIRAMTYLVLSRGSKGVLYHSYTSYKKRVYTKKSGDSTIILLDTSNVFPTTNLDYASESEYPNISSSSSVKTLGLRDSTSQPCEASYSGGTPILINCPGSNYWDGTKDTTFDYLCTLIPEIKAISDVLMQLEWDSAYSLKSTTPGKTSPCPHGYVDSVATTDSGYIDLGFFSPYYWQNYGEYLMVVNRDGIRDNEPDTITLYLDFDEGDTLYVVEYGDPDTVYYLPKEDDSCFHLGRWFAPGEGKLFRFESPKA